MPSPLSVRVTPLGSAPVSLIAGTGLPLVVTVKVPALPAVKVVPSAEVMLGAVPREIGLFDAFAEGPVPTVVTAATEGCTGRRW